MSQVGEQETVSESVIDVTTDCSAPPEEAGSGEINDQAGDKVAHVDVASDAPIVEEIPVPVSNSSTKPSPAMATAAVHKTNGSHAPGGPTTVKKVISSGTFGAGAHKSPVKPSTSKTTTTPAPTAVRKAASTSSTIKPAMSSRPATGPGHVRRASGVPSSAKASSPPPAKPLSASVSSKPPARLTETKPAVGVTPAARPRASISGEVKRVPVAPRPSSVGKGPTSTARTAAKPANTTVTTTKRPAGSISSIKEVQEGKSHIDLENKLHNTTEALDIKTEALKILQSEFEKVEAELKASNEESTATSTKLANLLAEKSALEAGADTTSDELETLRQEYESSKAALESVQNELHVAKESSVNQIDLIDTLQAKIHELEESVAASEALRTTQALSSSESASSNLADKEALATAHAELAALKDEMESLKATHSSILEDLSVKLTAAQETEASAAALQVRFAELQQEREETANKVTELEIEVLELKESSGTAEDEKNDALKKLAALQEELYVAQAAIQKASDDITAKDAEFLAQSTTIQSIHEETLKHAADTQSKASAELDEVKARLTKSLNAIEQAKVDAQTALEDHNVKLQEIESQYLVKQAELSDELKQVTTLLESQEAIYSEKVEGVKSEHTRLLQEAFERAKSEAMEAHGLDLQAVRQNFDATTSQLKAQHELALQDVQSEYASNLENQVKSLEKQITNINLDLKATQDDLAKSKAAVEESRREIEILTQQRDESRNAMASIPSTSPETAAELEKLQKELSVKIDDLVATKDLLSLTKTSLNDLSHNHTIDLEEAAKARADEVTQLKATYDKQLSDLATQKVDVLTRLSDMEGEMATLRAAAAAESTASPKSNGAAPPQSPGVTKEDLQRMHEAHNLKIHDLEAEHAKAMKVFEDKLAGLESEKEELNQEVVRKDMEIKYLEQDQEESQEQIQRLKEDLETISKQTEPEADA